MHELLIEIASLRLVQKKLVKRNKSEHDRRLVEIMLTEKGRGAILIYQKRKRRAQAEMMKMLSAVEQEKAILILEKLTRIGKKHDWEPV